MAKRYNVNLEVLSSFSGQPGTKVKEVAKTMEKPYVSGVAKDKNIARLALVGLPDKPGTAFRIFSTLARHKINVDIILQSIGRNDTDDIAKVSIVGAGMINNPGVASLMFEALFNAGINIHMISTSEIKVSVLVDKSDADNAVQVIHDRFFEEYGNL